MELQDLFEKCDSFKEADELRGLGLYPFFRKIQASEGREVISDGKSRIMISSNNYLGLTHDPRVQSAAMEAVSRYGTGCTGSRFLNGNFELHEELESKLASFLGKQSCLVFSTGFLANQGAISCLIGRNDVIFTDRENHASIVEGTRLALGKVIRYRHGDLENLRALLCSERGKYQGALIVTDGVFSMSGEIVDLPKLRSLADEHCCRLYVDDAHATGVLGAGGRGTEEYFREKGEKVIADLIMGTFSKSFAALGGFIAGEKRVVDFIRHKARPFIFSAAMSPVSVATVLECLKIIQEEPYRLQRLWANTREMSRALKAIGFDTLGSQTPIIPLLVGEDITAFRFARRLYEEGIFATPVVSPAVPIGQAVIRTSYMATHTSEDLTQVLGALHRIGVEFGILKSLEYSEPRGAHQNAYRTANQ